MRRAVATAAALLLVLLVASPAQAAKNVCTVVPEPVRLGQPWSLTVTGMSANAAYWVNVTQAKDPSNGGHPNGSLVTDAGGTGTASFSSTSWAPDGILVAGDAKARVYPMDATARGTLNCPFLVTG